MRLRVSSTSPRVDISYSKSSQLSCVTASSHGERIPEADQEFFYWDLICSCCGFEGRAETVDLEYPVCEHCGERHKNATLPVYYDL